MNYLINELKSYKYVRARRDIKRGQLLRQDDIHDHAADAMRYFLVAQGHTVGKRSIRPRIIKTIFWILAVALFALWLYLSR